MKRNTRLVACIVFGGVMIALGSWGLLRELKRRAAETHFKVLYKARQFDDGQTLAFTTLEAPEFNASPSVGIFPLQSPNATSKFIPTPFNPNRIEAFPDSDDLYVVQRFIRGTRAESHEILRLSKAGEALTPLVGEVPSVYVSRVSPDYLAALVWPNRRESKRNRVASFFRVDAGTLTPCGRFEHPDGECLVANVAAAGSNRVILYVDRREEGLSFFEVVLYDVPTQTIVTRVATSLDGREGSYIAVDSEQTIVALASHDHVEMRRLPDLELFDSFRGASYDFECLAVSQNGRFVACGGEGVWIWDSLKRSVRQLHPVSTTPALTLKTKGSFGNHMDHGAFMHNYMMHNRRRVRFLAFTDPDSHLLEITGDGEVTTWDVESSTPLGPPRRLWK